MCGFLRRFGEPMKTKTRVSKSSNLLRSSVVGEKRLANTTKSMTFDKQNSGMQLSNSDVCSLLELSSDEVTFDGWVPNADAHNHFEVAKMNSKCNFNHSGTNKTACRHFTLIKPGDGIFARQLYVP